MSSEDSKPSSALPCCDKVPAEKGEQQVTRGDRSFADQMTPETGTKTQLKVPQVVAAEAASPQAPASIPSRQLLRREGDSSTMSEEALEKKTFLLFVKILFKLLKEHQGDEFTSKAKRVVMECRRHNQQNHPAFIPLMEALERHLRLFVGDKLWARAHCYLHHYLGKEQERLRTGEPRPLALAAGS